MYTWGLGRSSHEEIPLLLFNLGEVDPIINTSVVVQVTHIVTYTSVPSGLVSGWEQARQHRWHPCHFPNPSRQSQAKGTDLCTSVTTTTSSLVAG